MLLTAKSTLHHCVESKDSQQLKAYAPLIAKY